MPELTAAQWDSFLSEHPDAHFMQARAWADLKSSFGWQAAWVVCGKAGAQVLFRNLPFGFRLAYLPRGPIGIQPWAGTSTASLWGEIDAACRRRNCVFLKAEPDAWDEGQAPQLDFRPSAQSIQPARTIIVDLRGSEIDLLQRMKQKTRYNVRLADKKGVKVHPGANLQEFHRLMEETGKRDAFGVHSLEYYQRAYDLFHSNGACELLFAEYEGQSLAAFMVFARGYRAWYVYGASSNEHRELMPTYLLQWEAMRWARLKGCTEYDLWGVPDEDEATLESGFEKRSEGLWGVYRNKRGFGGRLARSSGPWDRVYRPALYRVYQWFLRVRRLA